MEVFSTNLPSSKNINSTGQAWTKAKDRFKTPTFRRNELAPGHYAPKNNMVNDQDGTLTGGSVFKKSARAVIGRNKTDILNEKYHKRERDQVPGPG